MGREISDFTSGWVVMGDTNPNPKFSTAKDTQRRRWVIMAVQWFFRIRANTRRSVQHEPAGVNNRSWPLFSASPRAASLHPPGAKALLRRGEASLTVGGFEMPAYSGTARRRSAANSGGTGRRPYVPNLPDTHRGLAYSTT